MLYIEAPNHSGAFDPDESIFLAGSITGSWNWQAEIIPKLIYDFDVVNPRRDDFDVTNPNVEREQITWEHHFLSRCRHVLFYFSNETLAPITLFEYGTLLLDCKLGNKKLYVCIHPEYKRKNDVIIQTELRCPKLANEICYDLETLVNKVLNK